MTVRIVKLGPGVSVPKEILCRRCASTLGYAPNDVGSEKDSSWIQCPNCYGKVIVRS